MYKLFTTIFLTALSASSLASLKARLNENGYDEVNSDLSTCEQGYPAFCCPNDTDKTFQRKCKSAPEVESEYSCVTEETNNPYGYCCSGVDYSTGEKVATGCSHAELG